MATVIYYLNRTNMPEIEKIEVLSDEIKLYATTSFELLKLEAAERAAVIGSSMISGLLLAFLGLLFILFISLGAGFYLSELLGNAYLGFLIVGGFYLVLTLLVSIGKKGMLDRHFRDKVTQKIFSEDK